MRPDSLPAAEHPAVVHPTLQQIVETCQVAFQRDKDGRELPFVADDLCLLAAPATEEEVIKAAVWHAARFSVFAERETLVADRHRHQAAGHAGITVTFWAGDLESAHVAFPGRTYYTAQQVLGDEYARLVWFREDYKERDAYDRCRAFLLNVEAAAKDPARAQACSSTMAMISRKRDEQKADVARAEDLRLRQQQLNETRAQGDFQRQQAEAQRRRQIWGTTTNCTPVGYGVSCITN